MPFIYIYSPSDFIVAPPDEADAAAAGSATFTLMLAPGAQPTIVEITDNDSVFDEVDADQTLTSGINLDGTTYAAGTSINTAYDLINSGTGHKVTSFHFGGDGYQQGAVDGIASTIELVPGTTYTFDVERTSHTQNNQYSDYTACFAQNTLIQTPHGARPIETLRPGDMVVTGDGASQPLRLALTRAVSADELRDNPNLRPVRISRGALGAGLPARDLLVSPQHRMLVSSPIVQRMFGQNQVLISARKLTQLPGIFVDETVETVTYHHLVFTEHQIVFAENAPSESFLPAPQAMRALTPAARAEFQFLFPQQFQNTDPTPACMIPKGARQKKLVARHEKNARALLDTRII